MYTGETPEEFHARRAPLENLWGAFMASSMFGRAQSEYSVNMDDLLARAAVLSVPADRVREIVAAEHARAQVELKPFSWQTVQDQVNDAPNA